MTSRIKLCLVVLAICPTLLGCPSGAKAPTPTDLRSAVSVSVETVHALDAACSDVVHVVEQTDKPTALKIATDCSTIAHDALSSLSVANDLLDAYDATKRDAVLCALGHVGQALNSIAGIVQTHDAKLPPIILDARTLLQDAGAFAVAAACPIVIATADAGQDGG